LFEVAEGRDPGVLCGETAAPAPSPVGRLQVATANELGVPRGLVGAKMGQETAIAEGPSVAIYDEHASA
jgi:hypothetical protein